jgi:hypothetical protein
VIPKFQASYGPELLAHSIASRPDEYCDSSMNPRGCNLGMLGEWTSDIKVMYEFRQAQANNIYTTAVLATTLITLRLTKHSRFWSTNRIRSVFLLRNLAVSVEIVS